MRTSNGGMSYRDIMETGYGELFELNEGMSKLIKKENKEINRG